MTPEEKAELEELLDILGPERVVTKELEIRSHNPMMIDKLLQRKRKKNVLFSKFPVSEVKREGSGDCPKNC